MWQEYAVDPRALADFMHLRYVVEKFGYAQGRLLSQFPSDWLRQVYEATAGLPDVRRKAATVLLQRLKAEGLASFGREYRPIQSWLENARREHESRPFQGLVSNDHQPGFISVEDITEAHLTSLLTVRVVATSENLCAPMEYLLHSESELVFVDPYWRFGRPKCRVVLERMLSIALGGKCRRFTFVTRNDDRSESPAQVRRLLDQHFSDAFKAGFSLRAYLLEDVETEEKLHARYLVGRRAGLRYDKGFDEAPDERVEIGIMSKELHAEIRDLFIDKKHPGFASAVGVMLPETESRGFRFSGN